MKKRTQKGSGWVVEAGFIELAQKKMLSKKNGHAYPPLSILISPPLGAGLSSPYPASPSAAICGKLAADPKTHRPGLARSRRANE